MSYTLIIVGTGFASTFFLHGWLPLAPADARVLVLERGGRRPHAEQLKERGQPQREATASFTNTDPKKPWRFSLGLGGSSQCWWACTPRHLPEDFRLRSTYGVGADWPVSYEELEPVYAEVEEIMQVSGQQDVTPFPMSRPYPLPPHRLSPADEVLKRASPTQFFHQPTARPSRAVGARPQCCANGVCTACPIDSKFTVQNSMMHVYDDPRVELVTGAFVHGLDVAAGVVRAVRYRTGAREEHRAEADLVALGANAIFNPWILLNSGVSHPKLGRGLCEQRGRFVWAKLGDVDAYHGSTSLLGHAYHYASGPHRAERAAMIVETLNLPHVTDSRGQWRRKWALKAIMEEIPDDRNGVELDPDAPDRPRVVYGGPSARLLATADDLQPWMEKILAPLALDDLDVAPNMTATEGHVLCTHVMGADAATSVTDGKLVHHTLRNLLMLGGGAFPTAPPANPTLTISALALRAARELF